MRASLRPSAVLAAEMVPEIRTAASLELYLQMLSIAMYG